MLERTFSIIKPDAVKRNLIGEILARLEQNGLKVVASKMVCLTRDEAKDSMPNTKVSRFTKPWSIT